MRQYLEEGFWPYLIGLCHYNGRIFGLQFNRNAILELDHENRDLVYLGKIPGLPAWDPLSSDMKQPFHHIEIKDDKAYLVPFRYDRLYIYDFLSGGHSEIKLQINKRKTIEGKGNFFGCVFYGEKAVLLPFSYRGVLIVDVKTGEHTETDLSEDFPKETDPMLFRSYIRLDGHRIAAPSISSNKILIWDLDTSQYEVVFVPEKDLKGTAIRRVGNRAYILGNNFLRLWESDLSLSEFSDSHLFDEIEWDGRERKNYFDDRIFEEYDNDLFCFPAKWTQGIRVDLKSGKARVIRSLEPYCAEERIDRNLSIFSGGVRVGKHMYLQYQLNKILRFDLETEEIVEYSREFRDPKNKIFQDFLKALSDDPGRPDVRHTDTIGERIFRSI